MRDSSTHIKIDNPIEEARRYVDNAKKTVRDNEKYDPETGCYDDPKYIRSAGHYLWHAVLIMLDAVFHVKCYPLSDPVPRRTPSVRAKNPEHPYLVYKVPKHPGLVRSCRDIPAKAVLPRG